MAIELPKTGLCMLYDAMGGGCSIEASIQLSILRELTQTLV